MKPSKRRITKYRSVFMSDFHMGAKSFDDRAALSFLKAIECEYLFLVGDIIDGWKLKKRWYWTEGCNALLDHLFHMAAQGTQIYYLPGNHDDEIRSVMPLVKNRYASTFGFEIRDRMIHTLADGRRFVIMHGDQFDRKILQGALARWSDQLYDRLRDFVTGFRGPTIVISGERKPFSLAKYLAQQGKWALHIMNNFEAVAYRYALSQKAHGLICGHTHIPVIRNIRGILYANCGSWVGGPHAALVETPKGVLHLIDWPASPYPPIPDLPLSTADAVAPPLRYRAQTEKAVREIKKLWPAQKTVKKMAPSSASMRAPV
jgi:UDP-2,3-diacylglucosamine pyrophosphatase LpxH